MEPPYPHNSDLIQLVKGVGEFLETSSISNWTFDRTLDLSFFWLRRAFVEGTPGKRDSLFGLAGTTEKQLAGHRQNWILGKRAKEPSCIWRSSRDRKMSSVK